MKPIYTTTMPTEGRFTLVAPMNGGGILSLDCEWRGDKIKVHGVIDGSVRPEDLAGLHCLFITALDESEK